jgi:hypothetical protein
VRDGLEKETLAPYLYDDCYRVEMGCLLGHYFRRWAASVNGFTETVTL